MMRREEVTPMAMRDAETTLGKLMDHQSVSFISSVDGEGYPNTKAMLPPRERQGIKTFYYTTNTSSRRVAQFRANPKACLYFMDRRFFRGVVLQGSVEVLEDQPTKDRIWRDGDEKFYPLGKTDPDYGVLKFTALRGRYGNGKTSEDFEVP